jgi:hypothetical protein
MDLSMDLGFGYVLKVKFAEIIARRGGLLERTDGLRDANERMQPFQG